MKSEKRLALKSRDYPVSVNGGLSLLLAGLVSITVGCGGDSSTTRTDAYNIQGNTRVNSSLLTTAGGTQFLNEYSYDTDGRLIEITEDTNGTRTSRSLYSYNDDGSVASRVRDVLAEDGEDMMYEYVYEGDRLAGYFRSVVGQEKTASIQFQYSDGLFVGITENVFDSPTSNPMLSDGTLASTITYTLNESGYIVAHRFRRADGSSGDDRTFQVNAFGQRSTEEARNIDMAVVYVSEWNYEFGPCIKFPFGTASVTDWVCVSDPDQ